MLPFLDSDDDIYLNLAIVIVIIGALGKSNRGSFKINNSKLHVFLYLLKNPVVLNKVLGLCGKGSVLLSDIDSYSIISVSPNIDPLFDRESLKELLCILVVKNLITVVHKKNDGFFYELSEEGIATLASLREGYFSRVSELCDQLRNIINMSDSQLNQTLNQIIKKESA